MTKFKSKKPKVRMAENGYICIRGFIVPPRTLTGGRQSVITWIKDAKVISANDMQRRKLFIKKRS